MALGMHFDDRGQHRPGHKQSPIYNTSKKNGLLTPSAPQSRSGPFTAGCMNLTDPVLFPKHPPSTRWYTLAELQSSPYYGLATRWTIAGYRMRCWMSCMNTMQLKPALLLRH